jgi:hypothetical protein
MDINAGEIILASVGMFVAAALALIGHIGRRGLTFVFDQSQLWQRAHDSLVENLQGLRKEVESLLNTMRDKDVECIKCKLQTDTRLDGHEKRIHVLERKVGVEE